jgi:hypothetical protein
MSIFRKKPLGESSKIEKAKTEDKIKTDRIPLLPKSMVEEIPIRQSEPFKRTIAKLNRFSDMVISFEKKALSCNLYGISRDIIEGEHLTTDIDIYINKSKIFQGHLKKYNEMLERYKNSINLIENRCICKPRKR